MIKKFTIILSNKNKGFTLLEVMVASVILFSVIASVSMIYRGAFISSEKANNHVNIVSVLPSVLAQLRYNIREVGNLSTENLSGNGLAWNVHYIWKASLLSHRSAPRKFDIDEGKFMTPPKRYKLWLVDLTLEFNGIQKHYQFKEVSWSYE